MDGSQMHYPQWKKPDTNGYLTVWFYLHDILAKENYRDRNQISGCQVLRLREGFDSQRTWRNFLAWWKCLHLDCYMTVHTCQTHKIVHLEMQNFTVCNLYNHEPDFKKKKPLARSSRLFSAFWTIPSTFIIWSCSSILAPWGGADLEGHSTHWRWWSGKKLLNCWINQL